MNKSQPVGRPYTIWSLLLLCLVPSVVSASHLIAVEIRAKPVNCGSRTYEITVIGYVKIGGVTFGGDDSILSFGDGQSIAIPEQLSPVIIEPALNIGRVEFTTYHTYAATGVFTLSYGERNRNDGIANMDDSAFTTFYTESSITISSDRCDASPYLTVPPIDRACTGIAYYHNPGAVDADDDSVSFSFVIPKSEQGKDVKNYAYPNASKFYTAAGINHNAANEAGTAPPIFEIDPVDGTLTWDAPGAPGEYALAIKVTAWRFNITDSTWVESGFSIRDMQVVTEDCANRKPDVTVPADFCVVAGTPIVFNIPASDPDEHPVTIEAFSDVFALSDNPATITPADAALQSTAPPYDTASLKFTWNTSCLHVKNQPYKIVFKVTDTPPAGPRLVRFKTVSLRVIAPPPEYESVVINPITKKVTLNWKDYPCENVQNFQVWRRVAAYAYNQPECNIGMPYFLRYTLLATLPATSQSYVDDDIAIGAEYCYRIVALVGGNAIPSPISLDTCIIPRPAEAPVITNVIVVETDDDSGSMQLRWTSPFDIDKNQYPPPYTYKVYRSSGVGQNLFVEVTKDPISDTSFVDTQLNTLNSMYEYKIELFTPALTAAPVDTSSMASSVFLTATGERGQIRLTWESKTPWYNFLASYPRHLVYRSEQGIDGPFILIDSVDVNENGLEYIDNGKFQNRPLQEGRSYHYKVLTRGAYGNPAIPEPLENFSQVAASATLDSQPPCTPNVVIAKTDCGNLDCATDLYYNQISWNYPDIACVEDGLRYQIFVADNNGDEFLPLAVTSDHSFEHRNLSSLAKCYTVAAIDRAGNISSQSEPVCNDNCPYFELPNVFTPGAEDGMNDQFIAFGSANGTSRCARFVKEVDLKIYNRWGTEVYSINDATPEGSSLFWDGSSNSGKQMDSGVYFYSANVTFDVRDPAQQHKTIKGWVHLIRNQNR